MRTDQEQFETEAAGMEEYMADRCLKLRNALRKIEDLTHPDEDHADKDHMEMVERVNLMAQEALR